MSVLSSLPLRVVILDRVLSNWEDPKTQKLFQRVIGLKLKGYGKEYREGVIAIDGTDYFGSHLLVCKETLNGELFPVVGSRLVTRSRCDFYRNIFPALSLLRNSSPKPNEQPLLDLMDRCQKSGIELGFGSAWTMDPEYRKDREIARALRDVMTMIGVSFHRDYGVPEWLTCGMLRFKTNEYFSWMGLQEITGQFGHYTSWDEPAVMMHLKNFSPEAIEISNKFQDLWNRRIEILPPASVETFKKAA